MEYSLQNRIENVIYTRNTTKISTATGQDYDETSLVEICINKHYFFFVLFAGN